MAISDYMKKHHIHEIGLDERSLLVKEPVERITESDEIL